MSPSEIRVKDKGRTLQITFPGEGIFELSAEYLRVESPSAEVQGHTASEKKTVPGKRDVAITGAEPVGNYALRLIFSDGHSSGIYPWTGLLDMAKRHDEIWGNYLDNLAKLGLNR